MNKVIKLEDTKIYKIILEVFKDIPAKLTEIVSNLNELIQEYPLSFTDNNHLYLCFIWEDSRQGREYWYEIDTTITTYFSMKEKYMTSTKETKPEQKLISMDKQYTRNGKKVRVLCVDRPINNPVVIMEEDGGFLYFTKYGKCYDHADSSDFDLKEYSSWQDVAVDTKVYVKFFSYSEEVKRYFSHYEDGKVFVFQQGSTSFSTQWPGLDVYSARLA